MDVISNFVEKEMFTIELIMLGFLCSAGFTHRKKFAIRVAVAVVVCLGADYGLNQLVDYLNRLLDSSALTGFLLQFIKIFTNGYLWSFMLLFAAIAVCFKIRFGELIYTATTAYCIQHGMFCIERLTTQYIPQAMTSSRWLSYVLRLLIELVIFGIVWGIFYRKVNHENMKQIKFKQAIVCIGVILVVCIYVSSNVRDEGNMTAFRVADLICNIMCIVYQYSVLVISVDTNEKARLNELLEQSQRQYEISRENIELINIKCHDLKHIVNSFYESGKIDKSVLDEMNYTVDVYDACVKTGNAIMDVILTEKGLLCANRGIKFTCIADGGSLPMTASSEIYAFFANALDNAIEATEKVEDEEKKVISLTARKVDSFYSIQVQNFTADRAEFKDSIPLTTKPDKVNHGYGTKSMRMVIEKNGGKIAFNQKDDVFTLNAILPLKPAMAA